MKPVYRLSLAVALAFAPALAVPSPSKPVTDDYKKPSEEELKKRLTPEQFNVVCNEGTEPPFQNAYWNNKEPGIYVDVASGEPLFSSLDKFDSGTGWPSFWDPVEDDRVELRPDNSMFMKRTEVVCARCGGHLGHVFDDGPNPTGQRYCINSCALELDRNDDEG